MCRHNLQSPKPIEATSVGLGSHSICRAQFSLRGHAARTGQACRGSSSLEVSRQATGTIRPTWSVGAARTSKNRASRAPFLNRSCPIHNSCGLKAFSSFARSITSAVKPRRSHAKREDAPVALPPDLSFFENARQGTLKKPRSLPTQGASGERTLSGPSTGAL